MKYDINLLNSDYNKFITQLDDFSTKVETFKKDISTLEIKMEDK